MNQDELIEVICETGLLDGDDARSLAAHIEAQTFRDSERIATLETALREVLAKAEALIAACKQMGEEMTALAEALALAKAALLGRL